MKTDAIKLELIEWMARVTDEGVLKALVHFKNASQHDWADDLMPGQLEKIGQGMEDIRKGRTISNKKLWQKYGRKG